MNGPDGTGNSMFPAFRAAAALDGTPGARARAGLAALEAMDLWMARRADAGVVAAALLVADTAVARLVATDPVRGVLSNLSGAIRRSPADTPDAAIAVLMAYGRVLEFEGAYGSVVEVWGMVERLVPVEHDPDTVLLARLQQAWACIALGRLDDAARHGQSAEALGARLGMESATLRGQLYAASVAAVRGEYEEGARILDAIIARARAAGLTSVLWRALHTRGTTAGQSQDPRGMIAFGYEALGLCDSRSERSRLLGNIGEAMRVLGMTAAARDAFSVVLRTSADVALGAQTTLNLMALALDDGNLPAYTRLEPTLRTDAFTAQAVLEYEMLRGRALRLRGDEAGGVAALEAVRRRAVAERLGGVADMAAAALRGELPPPPAATAADPLLQNVAQALRAMRESLPPV